jgi:hypothetical protein
MLGATGTAGAVLLIRTCDFGGAIFSPFGAGGGVELGIFCGGATSGSPAGATGVPVAGIGATDGAQPPLAQLELPHVSQQAEPWCLLKRPLRPPKKLWPQPELHVSQPVLQVVVAQVLHVLQLLWPKPPKLNPRWPQPVLQVLQVLHVDTEPHVSQQLLWCLLKKPDIFWRQPWQPEL